jgi:hypothetical protein
MNENHPKQPPSARVYHFTVPPWLALLALAPLALLFVSMLAVLLAGGVAAALILPFVLRRTLRPPRQDTRTIELGPEDYRRIERRNE